MGLDLRFLLVFAGVNAANVKLGSKTGSKKFISVSGAALCLIALVMLIIQTAKTSPSNIWVLIIMAGLAFGIEALYREFRGRELKPEIKSGGKKKE